MVESIQYIQLLQNKLVAWTLSFDDLTVRRPDTANIPHCHIMFIFT